MSKVLLVNTRNVPALKGMIGRMLVDKSELSYAGIENTEPQHCVFGLPIFDSPHYPLHPTRWVFPDDPLWRYEKKDEVWCRYFKIGHEEELKDKIWIGMSESFDFDPFGQIPYGRVGPLSLRLPSLSEEDEVGIRIRSRLWPRGTGVLA